jgi:tetratricopeptide (TPR) repeat protein
MNEPHDDDRPGDVLSALGDSLDAGLAAGFGRRVEGPRSSLGEMRPVVLKVAEGESDHIVQPSSDAMPAPDQAGDRYQLFGEIARGGMGAVLRGRDVDLGRDLAVKVLLEKHAGRPEVVRRFIEEAQIGGQLQHPGVVPVYDVGRFGARPFFTMKLVKGQTLAALLGGREQATEDRPRLLGIALQVCQAMAYAHAKGVIHRDLKPANVMLGTFGEVQVMDWGLAKVLQEGGVADEARASRQHQDEGTQIRTARSVGTAGSHGTDTEAGSLLGTPAYMPPEQAIGDVVHLDRRTDVFGLGAILCEILTGKPPYVGRSYEEVRRKAANGDLADALARLDGCGADRELIALTKGCLEAEAIDRPKDAQEVADGLSAYLNGVQERLQAAERERAVAVVRASEEGKRRKVQLALAAAVVGLLLGSGAFAWWRNAQAQAGRERDARNAEAVAALLGQCAEALQASDAAKATVALEAARKRSAEGGAEGQAELLGRLDADLALLRELDAIDQFRWTPAEGQFPGLAVAATWTRAALRRFGADPDAGSVDEAAARVSASAVRQRIVTALDRVLGPEKTAGVRAVLRRVDTDRYRDAVRDAVLANDWAKIVELVEQKTALEQPPGFVAFLCVCVDIKVERRRQLLQAAVSRQPADLGLLMTLAGTYPINQKAGLIEQLRWYQAAVAAAPTNPAALNNLGEALREKGQVEEAIECYNKAIKFDPNYATPHSNLGLVLARKNQLDRAITCFKKAIELDPKCAPAHNNLGLALLDKDKAEEAIECLKKAVQLGPKLAKIHNNLGNALAGDGQVEEAIECYNKAIELDPDYASPHSNLGNALRGKGLLDEAIERHKKAIELDPNIARFHFNLGIVWYDKGQFDKAIDCYRKCIDLAPNHAGAHCNLGATLARQGRFAESLAAYKRGHELGTKQPRWGSPSAEWVRQAEATAALEAKLPEFLKGEFQPGDNKERLALAVVCVGKKLHHAATGLYAAAFAADPRLADERQTPHRFNAACNAALAAAGQGEDAAQLDDQERSRLRKQALNWLRADLALYTKQRESDKPADHVAAQQSLSQWQRDPDLAGLRDKAALDKLPAEEQKAFAQLWADVAALQKADKEKK